MANDATVHVRMDSKLKDSAESVFSQLGLSSSDAIKLFYKQVELNGGLPFEIKIPASVLAKQRLMHELEEGELSARNGDWIDIDESKNKLGL